MNYCPNCGSQLNPGTTQCPMCGATFAQQPTSYTADSQGGSSGSSGSSSQKKEKKEKKGHGCLIAFLVVLALVVVAVGGIVYVVYQEYEESMQPETMGQANWPTTGVATVLPVPEWAEVDEDTGEITLAGELVKDNDEVFSCIVAASEDEYQSYVNDCKEAGFTVDYESSASGYSAENEEGYSLSISYADEEDTDYDCTYMTVRVYVPEDEEEEAETSTDETSADDATTTDATESTGSSDETPEGVSEEFKATMDSYEDFYDEYIDFMETFANTDDTSEMMAEYIEFMAEYAEVTEALSAMEDEEMTDEEYAYFIEVQTRINQKLLEFAAETGEE